MYIESISLNDFRNYKSQKIYPDKGINIFFGENAQGKTNILESIYLLSTGKSHRTSKDNELLNWNSDDCKVKIEYNKESSENQIEVYLKRSGKKQLNINGVKKQRIGDILGNLNVTLFSPDHMRIIKEGPSERRKFIDIIQCQIKPKYYYNLCQYQKVLEQRNKLLVSIKKESKSSDLLDIWDEQLYFYGNVLIKERENFIKIINAYAKSVHSKITDNRENVDIIYKPSVSNNFLEELKYKRHKDIKNSITNIGPHRDDLLLYINGKDVKAYASQGQQRTVLLSLKLSELKFISDETKSYPILLLDDVFSELDTKRQNYLMDFIKDIQTFITCTDVSYFKNFRIDNYTLFNVNDGNITNII